MVAGRKVEVTARSNDENTLDELWKVNVGAGFTAPPMTLAVYGKQYVAIASGASAVSRAKLVNTPELRSTSVDCTLRLRALIELAILPRTLAGSSACE